MRGFQLTVVSLVFLSSSAFAQAQVSWSLGLRVGAPVYARPYHHHGWGPYYGPYYAPYYYAPRAVIYDAPVVVRSAPVYVESPPAVVPVPAASVVPVRNDVPAPATPRMDALLLQLADSSESARRDAAMDLGRMKSQRAIDPLMQMLAKDPIPQVREAAARALGLIASPRSLNALIYSAQADQDRDVRHSAQFAVEIIRTNLR